MILEGNYIDVLGKEIYPAIIHVHNGRVSKIVKSKKIFNKYLLPGLIDAHIHIESSMGVPRVFSDAAVSRGTTAVICDPHEIGNVLGEEGVRFMIEDSRKVPLKFYFGAPSCVPATDFETSGANISIEGIRRLLELQEITHLSEMMNYPGVINGDLVVMEKIKLAKKMGKPIDGHAPGLSGTSLKKYIEAGISTDHECSTIEEAEEKIGMGMKIQIREGSAARNLDSLKELINEYPNEVMLCSDDLHPEMLVKGHINLLVAKLISEGFDIFDVIKSCTVNPSLHYGIGTGTLSEGSPADIIVVDDPSRMNILESYIDGKNVYGDKQIKYSYSKGTRINKFNCEPVTAEQLIVKAKTDKFRAIEAYDGQLYTKELEFKVNKGITISSDVKKDLLKIVVKGRYNNSKAIVGFIKGFGSKKGAFSSSVAHDSHNIICVGTNDEDIVSAINAVIEMKGGLAVACGDHIETLELPIAGLMSDQPLEIIAGSYEKLSKTVIQYGSRMKAPFMTLSFMALLVIPELKIGDKGLFNINSYCNVPLFV